MRSEQSGELSAAHRNIVNSDVAEQLRVMADRVENGELDSVTDFWLVVRSLDERGKVTLPVSHAGIGEAQDLSSILAAMRQRAVC